VGRRAARDRADREQDGQGDRERDRGAAVPVYLRWSSVYLDKRIATGGTRYSLAPIALCLTAIVLGLDALRTRHRGATITLTVALSVLLTVCAITGGSATHTRTPSWSAQLPAARAACRRGLGRHRPDGEPDVHVAGARPVSSPVVGTAAGMTGHGTYLLSLLDR
jgi:hypothetical protein